MCFKSDLVINEQYKAISNLTMNIRTNALHYRLHYTKQTVYEDNDNESYN